MPPPLPGRQEASPGDQRAPDTPPPPRTPPSWGATGTALRPPGARGATRWGERPLDLLPRAHTGVPGQRAQQTSMEAAPHRTHP